LYYYKIQELQYCISLNQQYFPSFSQLTCDADELYNLFLIISILAFVSSWQFGSWKLTLCWLTFRI